MNNYSRRLFKF